MRLRALAVLAACWAAGASACPAPEGAEFYPTAKRLPENLLRVYVYFPRPMAEASVQLLDARDQPVAGVFLTNRTELWSPDRRRLTLLLDPGRVKTGLDAHEAMGRALVAGRAYTLEIAEATDTDGCPLGRATRHGFTAAPADLSPPSPAEWVLSTPEAGTNAPLVVALNTPHDHLSLAYRLRVLDAQGEALPGHVALGPGETSWSFTPRAPWTEAPHRLAIDERLEDLAGNRPGTLFDRPIDQAPSPWPRALSFTPTPGSSP